MPPELLAALQAGGPPALAIIGAIVGQLLSAGDRERAGQLLERASHIYGDIPLPGYEDFKEQILGPSAMENVRADPRETEAQFDALAALKRLSDQGGLTLQDQATQNEAMGDVTRSEQAARARIFERMRRAGVAGSGADFALQARSAQDAANRNAEIGLRTAGDAQARAYNAIIERGRMGGQMRAQDVEEQTNAARARDEINRYNAAARERGMLERNNIAHQGFSDRMSRANGEYQGLRDRAAGLYGNAAQTAVMWGGIGSGAGDVAQGVLDYLGPLPNQSQGGRGWGPP